LKKVTLTINGVKHESCVGPDKVLLDLLREDLHLTGAKQSCDRKGQCGACTVIVNKKAVKSCLRKVEQLDGAEVITVEGLGTPENPHLIQEAFVLTGAIQCGFCTPGMIMSTKALLDQNPNPSLADIKKAFARNLCRCTGYKKIIDAINLSAQFIRGETTPARVKKSTGKKVLGVSHPRPSSLIKACGVAIYTADIYPENALEIACVHSTQYHAKIKSIDSSAARKMAGVAGIMTAENIKGTNRIKMFTPDQPVLCEDVVRTLGDPIAIVAADTRDHARAAAAAIKVEYEPLPVMMTPEESLAEGAYQIHKHSSNLCDAQYQIKGDPEKALAKSAFVVECNFSTQMNHQAPLEPEASVAYLEGEGNKAELIIFGRSIWIGMHAAQIKEALGWNHVRYREPFVGGQFGIKLNITTEGIAGAAALHFKRPVRYVPSLTESMMISSKRHPFSMKVKLGADASGNLTVYTNEFVINKGAYFLSGPVIPNRALHMLSGPYNIPNIQAVSKLAFTNNASCGAARGAGPPQVAFALECAMDMLAEKLKIDPLEFRKNNSLKPGQSWCTGTIADEWPFPELCDAIKTNYEKAKKLASVYKQGIIRRGVGLGCHSFGIGDSGDSAKLAIEIEPDDGITIYAAVADPGEGNDSMLSQIAAQALGIPIDKVRLYTRDTAKTVDAGPAAASRLTFMAGLALLNAIDKLLTAMKDADSKTYAGLQKAGKPTRYEGEQHNEGSGILDPKTGQGDSFHSHVHNVQMAEVEVNSETGEVNVLRITSAVDAGTVIHPQNFEGQNEGGMDQGVGWTLREEYIHGKSKDWVTFRFPTIENTFDMKCIIRETPRIRGPLGATGIGEMTMTSTAPAVINAIKDACGVWICDLPATPEKIKEALSKK
jgi:aldehyde oxidoreductase